MRDRQEYLVDKIVAHRLMNDYNGDRNRTSYEFKIRWLGYTPSDDTWLPWKCISQLAALDKYLLNNDDLAKKIRVKVDEDNVL